MEPLTVDACAAHADAPLVALLGHAHDRFAAEVDALLKDSDYGALSLAHGRNVLRHLGRGPVRASAVVAQCGVTKQAVSQQVAHLERNGYVRVEPDPSDARARLLSLTAKGEAAQEFMSGLFVLVEQRWADALGAEDVAALRTTLARVLLD